MTDGAHEPAGSVELLCVFQFVGNFLADHPESPLGFPLGCVVPFRGGSPLLINWKRIVAT